jgi:endonuclease-8
MPEGDSIYQLASRLEGALIGEVLVDVYGSHRAVAEYGKRLIGRRPDSIYNRGKHLLMDFSGGWSMRSHMKMTGSWEVYSHSQPWRKEAGAARVVLNTENHIAVCFAAPDVEIKPSPLIHQALEYLGPDLTSDSFDETDAIRRLRSSQLPTLAEALLDQSTMAGIGNVYKSELLFLAGRLPTTAPSSLTEAEAAELVGNARRLMLANRMGPTRITTGDSRRPLYVYGRQRQGCRRCRGPIVSGRVGQPPRSTYWCPDCQTAI